MSLNEMKWEANQKKVGFLKAFPGLLNRWEETKGQTVQHIIPLPSHPKISVIVFSSGQFLLASDPETEPKYIREGLEAARPQLAFFHGPAFAQYDILANRDKEATKAVRLENILGAIRNNVDDIPELKDRIRSLVREWNS